MAQSANIAIRDDIIAHHVDLTRLQEPVVSEVHAILAALERDITAQLVRIDPTGPKRERYRRDRLEKLLVDVRASTASAYAESGRTSTRANTVVAGLENRFAQNTLDKAFGFGLGQPYLHRDTLIEMGLNTLIEGAPSREWWSRQSAGIVRSFRDEIRAGMLSGETLGQLVDRVNPIFNGPNGVSGKQFQAESLVRTSMISVANASKMRTYQQNSDVLKGIGWLSTLDARTTDICKGLDGLAWDMDLQPIGHKVSFPGYTAHWQCRSTQNPIVKSMSELAADESEEARRIAAEIDARNVPGTRSSLDGAIPAKTRYEDWLAGKESLEPGWALESGALTPAKYELWKRGQLDFRAMIDQRGNPLTVAEILERAGIGAEDLPVSIPAAIPRTEPDAAAAAAFELPAIQPVASRRMNDTEPGDMVSGIMSKHLSEEPLSESESAFVRKMSRGAFQLFNQRVQRLRDNLAGYARSVLAGIEPSEAQKKAYRLLTSAGRRRMDERISSART